MGSVSQIFLLKKENPLVPMGMGKVSSHYRGRGRKKSFEKPKRECFITEGKKGNLLKFIQGKYRSSIGVE